MAHRLLLFPDKWQEIRSSDGNLVNVGNFVAKGAKVNRWNSKNVNENLGVVSSRSVGDVTIAPTIIGAIVFVMMVEI